MIYTTFQDKQLPLLGFGAMRLPTLENGDIDEARTAEMVACAMEHGVNYFDTAYPYHNGESERVMGRILSKYPRESYYLATKYPGHQIVSTGYNPAATFQEQLDKCGVEYFDFYLLHNVNLQSVKTYLDPRWNIIQYFKEEKARGRIRHLGFSSHAELQGLEDFLDVAGQDMEFCQIQLNYLDWTLQDARRKCELLTRRNIPIWVMEPVRGGKLAALDPLSEAKLKAARPDESIAAWAFRFLQGLPNVGMILSGMSNMDQIRDNVKTFSQARCLSEEENRMLLSIAETLKDSVPCTGCRYCCDGCPAELDIPGLLGTFNELKIAPTMNTAMRIEFSPEDKRPTACIGCGQCVRICPQNIDIPGELKNLAQLLTTIPSWAETCRQREAAAKKKL